MTKTAAPTPALRFYIIAGGIHVTGPYGMFAEDCDPSTWTTHDDIRTCGGGWFRSRNAAKRAADALEDNGVYFAEIVQAANKTDAVAIRRAAEQARLKSVGLA